MPHSTELFSIEEDPFFAQDLIQMAKATHYRRWQFDMVSPYVSGKVLEIGGGIGNFTPDLARVAEWVASVEPNAACFRQLEQCTAGLANVSLHNVAAEALDRSLPAGFQADTVVCMNVLEHIQDDAAAVRTFVQRLKAGGRLVLLVPAGPWAFGEIDQRLGHYRRYSKRSARALLATTALTMERLRYYNFVGVWGWWWNAKFGHCGQQSDLQIRIFDKLMVPWLAWWERHIPPPIGQSLLVVGRTAAAP